MNPESQSLDYSLGAYRLAEKLGQGGMAEVFRATRSGSSESYALKRILPGLSRDREFSSMFEDEARVMRRVQHPNVVGVLDSGRAGQDLFIVLEYVDGPTVARLLRHAARFKRPLPIPVVLSIGVQLLSALRAVHAAVAEDGSPLHIVHRDVSPGNVLLSRGGRVKLGDFGIVRSEIVARRTMPGELKGKMGYMSPEQATGTPLDLRSDLYSVGIILAELLMLRPLFLGKNEVETLSRMVRGDLASWNQLKSQIPEPLGRVVERALQVEPRSRYFDALDMREALQMAGHQLGVQASESDVKRCLLELGMIPGSEAPSERGAVLSVQASPLLPPASSALGSSPFSSPRPESAEALGAAALVPASGAELTPLASGRSRASSCRLELISCDPERLGLSLCKAVTRLRDGNLELRKGTDCLTVHFRQGKLDFCLDSTGKGRLGEWLVSEGVLSPQELELQLSASARLGQRLGEKLLAERKIRTSVLERALASQFRERLGRYLALVPEVLSLEIEAEAPSSELHELSDAAFRVLELYRGSLLREQLAKELERCEPFPLHLGRPEQLSQLEDKLILTPPERRALALVMPGGGLEGKPMGELLEQLETERLARRREAQFALYGALMVGLLESEAWHPARRGVPASRSLLSRWSQDPPNSLSPPRNQDSHQ